MGQFYNVSWVLSASSVGFGNQISGDEAGVVETFEKKPERHCDIVQVRSPD